MSTYGEYLKKYIKEKGISVRKLSIETNINRTLLQKYLSGDRLPKNIEEVEHISECLMLSPEKQEKLKEGYNRSCYGIKRYESFLMIRDILNGLVDFQLNTSIKEDRNRKIVNQKEKKLFLSDYRKCEVCLGAMEVENMLRIIINEQIFSGQKSKLCILSQPEVGKLLSIVLSVCVGQSIEIEQIVCLDEDFSDGNSNMHIVYSMLPMLFSNIDYQSFYYYDKKDAHINSMSLLPVLIVTENCGMVCNAGMDESLVFYDEESVNFYLRQYQKIKTRTNLLTGHLRSITEWMSFIRNFVIEMATAQICIGETPCFTACLDERMFTSYLTLENEDRCFLIDVLSDNRNKLMQNKGIVNIFSESGLREFMETGRSNEYPDNCYCPFSPSDRRIILERAIHLAEEGVILYNMTNSFFLKLDKSLLIYINEKIVFQYQKKYCLGQYFHINERTVRQEFQDFVNFAKKNKWIYGENETLLRMKAILAEYEKRVL